MQTAKSEFHHPKEPLECKLCGTTVAPSDFCRIIAVSPDRGFSVKAVFRCCEPCGKLPEPELHQKILDNLSS